MAVKTSTSITNNAVEQRDSRYVQGGETDRYSNRLGWWERKIFEPDDSDILVTIQSSEDRRPDLVANRIYRKSTFMWLVLQFNNIVDIQTEFIAGKELMLPSPRRVTLDIATQPTGGNRIK